MADVQKQFEQFHERIRFDFEMSSELREKRDIILDRIHKWLRDNEKPSCQILLQGSYKLKTGVKPIAELEYDMDIGLRFNINEGDFKASEVRNWVFEAIENHTKSAENKGPCIRVVYEKGFRLDLVIYAVWEDHAGREQYRLAHKTDGWRESDPPKLLEYINDYRKSHFANTDDHRTKTDQFRRCIRAIRRWADVQTPYESKSKPTGLAFVLLAIQHGLTSATFIDGRSDDRTAIERLICTLAKTYGRLRADKPTPEYEDVLSRLSNAEMDQFKEQLVDLSDALNVSGITTDPTEACKKLAKVFGGDFPVPDPEETAKKTAAPAIITSSSSA